MQKRDKVPQSPSHGIRRLLNPQGVVRGEGVWNIFWHVGKKILALFKILVSVLGVSLYMTVMGCILCNPFSPSVTPRERLLTEVSDSLLRSLWELKGIPQMQPKRCRCMHSQTNWRSKTSRCLEKAILFSYFCWQMIRSLPVSLALPKVSIE